MTPTALTALFLVAATGSFKGKSSENPLCTHFLFLLEERLATGSHLGNKFGGYFEAPL